MSKKRRNHSPEFKSKVALAAIKGDQTLSELSRQYGINSNLIVKWKKQLIDQIPVVLLVPDLPGNISCLYSLLHPLKKWSLRQTWGDSVGHYLTV